MKIKGGDMLIVQGVAKQTTQSKGLRVSTRVNLTGQTVGAHSRRNGRSYFKKSKKSGDASRCLCGNWKANLPGRIARLSFGRLPSMLTVEQLLRDEANELYAENVVRQLA